MRRARGIVVGVCLLASACGEDPARSMKIIPRPPAAVSPAAASRAEAQPPAVGPAPDTQAARSSGTAVRPPRGGASGSPAAVARAAATDWRPPGCPPPPEASSGSSSFTVAGPCAFEHRNAVACESLGDDFLVTLSRKAAGGVALMVYINVEHYHGPGDYAGAEIYVGLQDKINIYRWSSDTLNITVGSGEEFVTLPATSLEAEPLFVNCTGPMTNFQCEGRGGADEFQKTREVVAGTLRCATRK